MASPHLRNDGSAQLGDNAEARFVRIAGKKGWKVKKSSRHDDRINHIDYYLTGRDKDGSDFTFSVEVKSRKALRRGQPVQDKWLYLEFKGIEGHDGWLYGKATFIAFEVEDGFILVNRAKLAAWGEEAVDGSKRATWAGGARYIRYSRRDRPDEFVSIVERTRVEEEVGCIRW